MTRLLPHHPLRMALLTLGLLWFDLLLLPHLPNFGAQPFLLPLLLVCLCLRESVAPSALSGLFLGLCAAMLGQGLWTVFACTLVAAGLSLLYRYGLQRSFFGALLGGILSLSALSIFRFLWLYAHYGASFFAPFSIFVAELLQSLLYFPLIYLLCTLVLGRATHNRQEAYV